jgi:hypothetical protein
MKTIEKLSSSHGLDEFYNFPHVQVLGSLGCRGFPIKYYQFLDFSFEINPNESNIYPMIGGYVPSN